MKLAITGGRVYDPANGIDGETRTVLVDGGKIVEADEASFGAERTIDARGRIVMPGGVDMHCHIAGTAVNRGRRLLAGEGGAGAVAPAPSRRDEAGLIPTAGSTGLRYSLLGYTTAVEAAVAPSSSRECHVELAGTPGLTRAFLLLLANSELLLDALDRGEEELAGEVAARLLQRTGAFGIKSVNAGGVSQWKKTARGIARHAEPLEGRRVSPRDIIAFLARTAERLELPHPVHIHAARLGAPGNIDVTLETSRALEGRRHHLTHVQFHVYGRDGTGGVESAAARFVEHLASTPELTADVGQVMFGDALTLSADEEVEHYLWKVTGKPWVNLDVELETGCGIVPIEYRPRSRMHAFQWAVGMELLLLNPDPWRLAMSTDHPNGASFLAYPVLIAQLMDHGLRREVLRRAGGGMLERSPLRELDREYTLGEIAIITRAAPARILGLAGKGHLGNGADADITIYDDRSDREVMFRRPWRVIRAGKVVVEDGEARRPGEGETLRVSPDADPRGEEEIRRWFERHGSYHPDQLGPPRELLDECAVVGGGAG